jgi:hypothetical protein
MIKDAGHLRATGQSAARARAYINLTPEKRTRIHEVIVNKRSAPRVANPNFNVSVGACAAYRAVRSSSVDHRGNRLSPGGTI